MMPIEILEEEYVSHSASQPFSGMTLFGEMIPPHMMVRFHLCKFIAQVKLYPQTARNA